MNEKKLHFIGQNIRKWRKAQSLTQEQLALRSDMSQSYINQLESGKKGFSRDSLIRVAKALGIPVNSMFNEDDSLEIVRFHSEGAGPKGRVTQYVVMKPEPYAERREREKILMKELSDAAKQLPQDVLEHYVRLMKMEAKTLKKK